MMEPRITVARKLCEQAQDVWADGKRYWLTCADEILAALAAQGTEARRATTVEQGVVHDGPVRDSECAHTPHSSGGDK